MLAYSAFQLGVTTCASSHVRLKQLLSALPPAELEPYPDWRRTNTNKLQNRVFAFFVSQSVYQGTVGVRFSLTCFSPAEPCQGPIVRPRPDSHAIAF